MRAETAQMRLCICAGSSERSSTAYGAIYIAKYHMLAQMENNSNILDVKQLQTTGACIFQRK